MGSAHRGQYGDGRLEQTDQFVRTASGAAQITAHTGRAILLTKNGDVLGTGGNIYGPVGNYGLGDKAVRWSKIMSDVRAIATGSSHSLAIRKDGTLMAWGNGYGVEAVSVLSEVVAVAAGSRTTIAIKRDDTLWQWGHAKSPKQLRLPKQ
jgi:alpha-tubulin suppressor-like RCC1 family protein